MYPTVVDVRHNKGVTVIQVKRADKKNRNKGGLLYMLLSVFILLITVMPFRVYLP
jgi:hypothetical protein